LINRVDNDKNLKKVPTDEKYCMKQAQISHNMKKCKLNLYHFI